MNNPFTPERIATAKNVTTKTVKYGLTFFGGILVGTICGVVLFFRISDGDI